MEKGDSQTAIFCAEVIAEEIDGELALDIYSTQADSGPSAGVVIGSDEAG